MNAAAAAPLGRLGSNAGGEAVAGGKTGKVVAEKVAPLLEIDQDVVQDRIIASLNRVRRATQKRVARVLAWTSRNRRDGKSR